MGKAIRIVHVFLAILGQIFCLFIFLFAYENYVDGLSIAYTRFILAILLSAYCFLQFFVAYKGLTSVIKIIIFPLVYLMLGFVWIYASAGYRKGWDPAPESEAFVMNAIYGGILLAIASFGVLLSLFGKADSNDT